MKVMARFSPECAVVLLEHLDTPVTRFLLSHPPLSRLFEPQVRPSGCHEACSALAAVRMPLLPQNGPHGEHEATASLIMPVQQRHCTALHTSL